jgi:hypothetical protein
VYGDEKSTGLLNFSRKTEEKGRLEDRDTDLRIILK